LKGLSRAWPARLILAVPVAPADIIERLRTEADEVVCLLTPEPFYAVGEHYDDFRQTSDREVTTLLDEARLWSRENVP
jgi:putative phosphoribosyl transferase